MPSNHLILCRPLLLSPSIFPSSRVFSNESALHIRWPKNWSFSFNISPSNEYSGLISFRMDWLDFLAVQGTLKSLLQHHSSKASILQRSAFFIVQLSNSYMTTGKTIALTKQTFVGKAMSLLFNMLSRFVIRQKDRTLKDEFLRSVAAQYATGEEWGNNSRKDENTEPKRKQCPVVDVTGDRIKVQCCKEPYCIGTCNVRSMNQGKLEVVKRR